MNTLAQPEAFNAVVRSRFGILSLVSPRTAARKGTDLFCTPSASGCRHEGSVAPIAGASQSLSQVNGHELATYVWGDTGRQPYVLLAHGWSGHAMQFHAWVSVLRSAGFAVVAFDQQAHGSSSGRTATLRDFVCNLISIGRHHGHAAAVIGHSLGGSAVAIALSRGLEADCAVLIAAEADPDAAIRRFARRMGLPEAVYRRMATLYERRIGSALTDLQAHRITPSIARPALVVHDLLDQEVPWEEGERYARHWPYSRLFTTTGLGHYRIARDEAVIASCLRFVRGETVGERLVSSPNLPFGFA